MKFKNERLRIKTVPFTQFIFLEMFTKNKNFESHLFPQIINITVMNVDNCLYDIDLENMLIEICNDKVMYGIPMDRSVNLNDWYKNFTKHGNPDFTRVSLFESSEYDDTVHESSNRESVTINFTEFTRSMIIKATIITCI